ncbi:TfuA-like protein [Micromonospora sp. NPDC047074]|uniref:TfuA-like protein n=1 Tax=Micromonospora sp. NPDC047074 TaxID=3154339 RepID=UPI0033D9B594
MSTGKPLLYVGPTAFGVDPALFSRGGVAVLPPIRRGDVHDLVTSGTTPGIIAIVDGTFHSYPSTGHAEIRSALEQGWEVWGLSSMGAIRAREMSTLGMKGFGKVYRRYAETANFDDDEVTLVHAAEAPYQPISEPLIHLREALRQLAAGGRITMTAAEEITGFLKRRWYGERTLRLFKESLVDMGGLSSDEASHELRNFDSYRIKTHDLVSFLEVKPWLSRPSRPAG